MSSNTNNKLYVEYSIRFIVVRASVCYIFSFLKAGVMSFTVNVYCDKKVLDEFKL